MSTTSKSLPEIQAEVRAWALREFGLTHSRDGTSSLYGAPLDSLAPLMGMVGEVGELVQETLKRHQGRGATVTMEAFREAKVDALGDLLVFACDYAGREGIDLLAALNKTWEKVCKRRRASWDADSDAEKTTHTVPINVPPGILATNVLPPSGLGEREYDPGYESGAYDVDPDKQEGE